MALTSIDYNDPDLTFSSDEEESVVRTDLQQWVGDEASSSEDEFAAEMEAELDLAVKKSTSKDFVSLTNSGAKERKSRKRTKYDEVYFDSDEEGQENVAGTSKRNIPSNDDLFYDPDMDDNDAKWMEKKIQENKPKQKTGVPEVTKPASSDAVLNCPACFSLLSLDCQRHITYKTQYRAMFVLNCRIDYSQKLHFVPNSKERNRMKREKKKENTETEEENDELFHPVQCVTCNTRIAVYDKNEVYHFFNVLASHT